MKEQAKHKILAALAKCGDGGAFADAARGLFVAMGYDSGRSIPIDNSAKSFVSEYPAKREKTKSEEHFCRHVQRVMGLFQFSDSEMEAAGAQDRKAFDKSIVKSFLFFAAQVADGGHSRGDYAKWTREINKRFAIPAVVLFYCVKDGETKVTFSFVGSRQSKVAAQERVLEAVSLLREIDAKKPHRGHLDVLADLSFDMRKRWIENRRRDERDVTFDSLLVAWLDELNADSLGGRFYKDLRGWFNRVVEKAKFPKTMSKEDHAIRLINRILFIWFLKEKGLVREDLFLQKIGDCLKSGLPNDGGDYYCAVLQNLFFGTLNTKIGKRGFRDKSFLGKYDNPEHKDFSLYRYEDLISNKKILLNYFEQSPFVNGGLFDCLDDFAAGKKGGKRVDCFTDNTSHRKFLHVPNHLFFGESEDAPGLFKIFSHYKFTVEENTPTEQEVALDPELLGMVYERLLDSVINRNRKEVGAYYTPRRIVDYMTREALTAYFSNKMSKTNDLEKRLRDLLTAEVDYDNLRKEEKLNDAETRQFIEMAARLRLLDPAVGSGAFLMGALAQITMAFNRVDPKNDILHKREKKHAEGFSDESAKSLALKAVEEVFSEKNKYNSYGRKLTLIRDCLFGVDLLPAAVQICRLRFFISLAIEQDRSNNKSENYGIRSLPNLEARMVAADTLRSIGKENPLFGESDQVAEIKKELRGIRHRFFAASTRFQKLKCIEEDEKKREELAKCLKSLNFPKNAAESIANWDLYDPKVEADWFDPEWMFGEAEGFDVIIGNPPYVPLQNNQSKLARKYKGEGFHVFDRSGDIYQLFYEKGHSLLGENGCLCFITSNKWMRAGYGEKMRDWFGKKTGPLKLLDLGPDVFSSATVDTSIFMFSKNPINPQKLQAINLEKGDDLLNVALPSLPIPQAGDPWVILTSEEAALKAKIEKAGTPLKEWKELGNKIYRGVLTGLNEAFVIDNAKKQALTRQDPRSAEIIKPILRGRDIERYRASWAGQWLIATFPSLHLNIDDYPAVKSHLLRFGINRLEQTGKKYLNNVKARKKTPHAWYELQDTCAYHALFEEEKIAYNDINDAGNLSFALCKPGLYVNNTVYFVANNKNLYFQLAVLNSAVINWYYRLISVQLGAHAVRMFSIYVNQIPIPFPTSHNRELIAQIANMGKQIAATREQNGDCAGMEKLVENLIYDLYGLSAEDREFLERERAKSSTMLISESSKP